MIKLLRTNFEPLCLRPGGVKNAYLRLDGEEVKIKGTNLDNKLSNDADQTSFGRVVRYSQIWSWPGPQTGQVQGGLHH